jgi:hypothetical protein
MPFLLRVELPDVPGSLGRVATSIGEAGGDIEAIEIVEHRADGHAVDDVLLELAPGIMPDTIISACAELEGVKVLWISRYPAGGNLMLDLEAVEELAETPDQAVERLVPMLLATFRVDWAARVDPDGSIAQGTEAAPEKLAWSQLHRAARLPVDDDVTLCAAAPIRKGAGQIVVIGREGGPDFLDS